MGGLLHLFDFNQGSMARKLFRHKKHDGGICAPRNSMEMQAETSHGYSDMGDLPLYQVKEVDLKRNYPLKNSMKNLINEEMSRCSNTRRNGPIIVARLMGMDTLPMDTKSAVQPISSKKEMSVKSSADRVSSNINSSKELDLSCFYKNSDTDNAGWCEDQKIGKLRHEEHPQEEELQKFKKEFEVWKAAKFKECSRIVENDSISGEFLAHEHLDKEKTETSAKSKQPRIEKTMERMNHIVKEISHERGVDGTDLFPSEKTRSLSSNSKIKSLDFEQLSTINFRKRVNVSSAPTSIVILKPDLDSLCNHEETRINSPNNLAQKVSIEDFLEEVKERLRCELQGKVHKKGSLVRGSGIETQFSELPSPKKIARHIANNVRENVTRDVGVKLLRSESTRSYRSEVQYNGLGSPELLHRDTRRLLLERLKVVSERETVHNSHVLTFGSSPSPVLDYGKIKVNLETQNNMSFFGRGIVKDDHAKIRSFTNGSDADKFLNREFSPTKLVRSLSAPVSGTSFGQLLLENRHIVTGACVQMKQEAIENVSLDTKNQKKQRFHFKEKVSNFKYNFTIRKRLFGKRSRSVTESRRTELYTVNDIRSGPTVITNFRERHDNFTEVPPSPASLCSPARDDFYRTFDCLSPISTPNATPREYRAAPQAFRDTSNNLSEPRRQLNQLESDEPNYASVEQEVVESEVSGLMDLAEVYIKDLLVASGLYDGSFEKSFSRYDSFRKPISLSVFKQVEESYKKMASVDDSSTKDHNAKVNHKLLLDLLNEALSTVLGPPSNISKFRRVAINSSALQHLRGKKLLDSVCEIIFPSYLRNGRHCHSLEEMVTRELKSQPWPELLEEDVNVMGRKIEALIMGDLVTEVFDDIKDEVLS